MFMLYPFLISLALASQGDNLKAWFKSCREKSFDEIKKFGDAYIYYKHSLEDFEKPEALNNWNYIDKNCYKMILFDYDFQSERDNEILRWFAELGMPIANYHFQVAKSEEELEFLIKSAQNRGQQIPIENLVCIAAMKGFKQLYINLRDQVWKSEVVGQIDHVSWGERSPPVRQVESVAYTPLLAAVSNNQVDMIEYLIRSESNPFSLAAKMHPLAKALSCYKGTTASQKTVELLVSSGCDLAPWKEIAAQPGSWDYKRCVKNGFEVAINRGIERRYCLLKAFHDVKAELLKDGYLLCEIKSALESMYYLPLDLSTHLVVANLFNP